MNNYEEALLKLIEKYTEDIQFSDHLHKIGDIDDDVHYSVTHTLHNVIKDLQKLIGGHNE